jgi:hypothetical protein
MMNKIEMKLMLNKLLLSNKWCGKKFGCDDSDCPFRGGMIRNHGYNRFNCFGCDYDLCDSCVHRKLFVLTKVVKRQESNHVGLLQTKIYKL